MLMLLLKHSERSIENGLGLISLFSHLQSLPHIFIAQNVESSIVGFDGIQQVSHLTRETCKLVDNHLNMIVGAFLHLVILFFQAGKQWNEEEI